MSFATGKIYWTGGDPWERTDWIDGIAHIYDWAVIILMGIMIIIFRMKLDRMEAEEQYFQMVSSSANGPLCKDTAVGKEEEPSLPIEDDIQNIMKNRAARQNNLDANKLNISDTEQNVKIVRADPGANLMKAQAKQSQSASEARKKKPTVKSKREQTKKDSSKQEVPSKTVQKVVDVKDMKEDLANFPRPKKGNRDEMLAEMEEILLGLGSDPLTESNSKGDKKKSGKSAKPMRNQEMKSRETQASGMKTSNSKEAEDGMSVVKPPEQVRKQKSARENIAKTGTPAKTVERDERDEEDSDHKQKSGKSGRSGKSGKSSKDKPMPKKPDLTAVSMMTIGNVSREGSAEPGAADEVEKSGKDKK